MKKNANKQKKNGITTLKRILKNDGRKLAWLSAVTGIQYQRLQRIVNQGYDPTITEALKIATALRKTIMEIFPFEGLREALLYTDSEQLAHRGKSRKAFQPHR